jgi:hypothetical protein
MSISGRGCVLATVALSAALMSASMAWATLLTPTVVAGGVGNQLSPAATPGATYLAYSASRPGAPNLLDIYVKPAVGARIKVNATGHGFAGGIDGNTLVFQHIVNGQSNINSYDLTGNTVSVPAGVNTTGWEWNPTISGNWLLFGRENPNVKPVSDHILLHNTSTQATLLLDQQVGTPDKILSPGQVNGDFVTWDRFTPSKASGTVVRYQISTATRLTVPLPIGKVQYASSTDAAGDIFYVRSGQACGKAVVIREDVPGGSDVPLAAMPAGYDIFRTYAVDESGGGVTLYFDRFNCATGNGGDVYKLTLP